MEQSTRPVKTTDKVRRFKQPSAFRKMYEYFSARGMGQIFIKSIRHPKFDEAGTI